MTLQHGDDYAVETLFLLWAARETGVVDALVERSGTPEAVAAETDVTEESARVVVDALADLGFLARVGDEYEPTNRALGFLAKRDVRSIGSLPAALDELDRLTDLPASMTVDPDSALTPTDRRSDERRNELGAHAATDEAEVRARVTAAVRAAGGPETALDVCGGSGVYAREFAARGVETTMLDDVESVSTVSPHLASSDVTLTSESVGDLSTSFDLVFAADLCTSLSAAENAALLPVAAERVLPGGTLAFAETVRDRAATETAVAADVRGLARGSGRAYAEADYRGWLSAAGLERVRFESIPGTDATLVTAKREVD